MAEGLYHPPQFSEDAAWLPPWLQPNQMPFVDDDQTNSAQTPFQIPSESASNQGDFTCRENFLWSMEGDYRHGGLQLFLSGEDNSPLGSTPSSGSVLHVDLHLPSEGISQFPSDQPYSGLEMGMSETNKDPSQKCLPKIPVTLKEPYCQDKIDDGVLLERSSPAGCSSRKCESNKQQLNNLDIQNSVFQNDLRCQYKIEDEALRENFSSGGLTSRTLTRSSSKIPKKIKQLKVSDANEAVELSIAASEAVVISELATTDSHLELLPSKAILEIALRVKQERNQYYLEDIDTAFAYPTDLSDDIDELSDLDDDAMAVAYNDAGISITRVIETPDDSCTDIVFLQKNSDTKSPEAKEGCFLHSSAVNTHISESHSGFENMPNNGINVQNSKFNVITSRDESGHKLKDLPLEALFVQKMEPPTDSCFDLNTSKMKSLSNACPSNSIQVIVDSLASVRVDSEENTNQKDGKGIIHGDRNDNKAIPKFFIAESSSISESLDAFMGESMSVQRQEAGIEIIASSGTLFGDVHRSACERNKTTNRETVLSQDLVGSNFSSVDPLCSAVPCSISLDDDYIGLACNQIILDETAEKCLNHATTLQSSPSKGEETAPLSTSAHMKGITTSSIRTESHGVSRKQVASLKTYSMVVPPRNTNLAGDVVLSEKTPVCLISSNNENSAADLLKPNMNWQETNNPKNKSNENNENSSGLFSNMELRNAGSDLNGVQLLENQNVERCSSLAINNGSRHRVWAYNMIYNSENEDESLHLNLQCPLKGESLPRKRVRFVEAECNILETNLSNRSPGVHRPCLHTKPSKMVKDSCQRSLYGKRKEIILHIQDGKKRTFHDLEFLLTGFPKKKKMEVETLIRIHGGVVLPNVEPASQLRGKRGFGCSNQQYPVVLSPKKVQTTKFLYGCAINTWILNANWLFNSVQAGCILPPWKYTILPNQSFGRKHLIIGQAPSCSQNGIFDGLGIMLYGKSSFCTKYSIIIKHGGGCVFKTLHWLVQSLKNGNNSIGAILVEDENNVSRHLKHCALEHDLCTLPASWIVNSLYSGKLLPLKDCSIPFHRIKMPEFPQARTLDLSQEI